MRVQKLPPDDEFVCSKHVEDSVIEINQRDKGVHLVCLSQIDRRELYFE